MRFNFDFSEPNDTTGTDDGPTVTPHSSSTPKEHHKWVSIQNHPLFKNATSSTTTDDVVAGARCSTAPTPRNLVAWDGASHLYLWDPDKLCVHRISVRLGEPDPTSVLASSPSKVLQADKQLSFLVSKISINRNGSALLLAGSDGIFVMYLSGRTSAKDSTIICRTVSIGLEIYFNANIAIRTLQASWHPYSDTHLGILSSDSVFRLFDLSSSLVKPEQEYYLQPVEPGKSRNAASICPVAFSFGGDHLWDRFSVFVLFSDGSKYILCPIVPFGSVVPWDLILDIYGEAQTFQMKSGSPKAVSNSSLAISWLEATFPGLANEVGEELALPAVRAQPYALFDASIALQGPLRKVHHGGKQDPETRATECEGQAVSLLYSSISKDSILVTAWSGGQLQIDALADEIQPLWSMASPPRFSVNKSDCIIAIAMICEPIIPPIDNSAVLMNHNHRHEPPSPLDHSVWLGIPPPLLRLAIVDLALPKSKNGSLISMLVDPLLPQRIYCLHNGGIDSIVLHFLPFTNQTRAMKTASVYPVLTSPTPPLSPLRGFVAFSDSAANSWALAVTSSGECVVLEMETWKLLVPVGFDTEIKAALNMEEDRETEDSTTIISNKLLGGPNSVLLPPSTLKLRTVNADSIEGRSILHQYFDLFHENYVEYAHKVYFELKHHVPRLKKIIDDHHSRLNGAKQKLLKVEEKDRKLEVRIDRAIQIQNQMEERLQRLRNLPGAHKKPLSKAEREFKLELDRFSGIDLDNLRSSVDVINARLKKHINYSQNNLSNNKRRQQLLLGRKKNRVEDEELSKLRSSISKLSLVNSENTRKVKLVEFALKNHEID